MLGAGCWGVVLGAVAAEATHTAGHHNIYAGSALYYGLAGGGVMAVAVLGGCIFFCRSLRQRLVLGRAAAATQAQSPVRTPRFMASPPGAPMMSRTSVPFVYVTGALSCGSDADSLASAKLRSGTPVPPPPPPPPPRHCSFS